MSPVIVDLPDAPALAGRLYMDAELRPNLSLSRRGAAIVLLVVGAASVACAALFFSMGAWPVAGFFGLDAALIAWAFHAHHTAAKRQGERVRVTAEAVHVERRGPRGPARHYAVSPSFARVSLDEPVEHDSPVVLSAGGRSVPLGRLLAPHERPGFARALRAAIAAARTARG